LDVFVDDASTLPCLETAQPSSDTILSLMSRSSYAELCFDSISLQEQSESLCLPAVSL
jgi:hypothetical protein